MPDQKYLIRYCVDIISDSFNGKVLSNKVFIGTLQEFKKLKRKLFKWGYKFIEVDSMENYCADKWVEVPF